jgi:hypothetical protein
LVATALRGFVLSSLGVAQLSDQRLLGLEILPQRAERGVDLRQGVEDGSIGLSGARALLRRRVDLRPRARQHIAHVARVNGQGGWHEPIRVLAEQERPRLAGRGVVQGQGLRPSVTGLVLGLPQDALEQPQGTGKLVEMLRHQLRGDFLTLERP